MHQRQSFLNQNLECFSNFENCTFLYSLEAYTDTKYGSKVGDLLENSRISLKISPQESNIRHGGKIEARLADRAIAS